MIFARFFWNFKTELPSKWDYVKAVDNGWIPRDPTAWDEAVETACNVRRAALRPAVALPLPRRMRLTACELTSLPSDALPTLPSAPLCASRTSCA